MLFKLMTELLHSIHECVAFFFIFPLALCRNKCASGCPENTTCEWGLCQCEDPEMVQIWGECVLPDDENLLHRNGTLSEEEIVGVSCLNDSDCQAMWTTMTKEKQSISLFFFQAEDVNALCVNSECKCRQEMQWNKVALECQVPRINVMVMWQNCKFLPRRPGQRCTFHKTGFHRCWLWWLGWLLLCEQPLQRYIESRRRLQKGIQGLLREAWSHYEHHGPWLFHFESLGHSSWKTLWILRQQLPINLGTEEGVLYQ